MAYLKDKPEWTEGVHQIEKNDLVRGGPDGPDNLPLRDLAKRTKYLKKLFGTVVTIEEEE
uniref:Uncharacterized protein n=1 Tax=uncultured bacterium contig00055 TaxID=1181539 RepID=A0A806KFW6_9BACT|nr:hypothetical protein [uncultured bacterium contig00055]